MDKIINILLLIIIFVFDPLAIALVVAANFAFDQAYKRNLYGELEDDTKPDLWDDLDDEDWDPGYEDYLKGTKLKDDGSYDDNQDEPDLPDPNNDLTKASKEYEQVTKEKQPVKILQKSPGKRRIEFDDGSEEWIDRKDIDDDSLTIKYL
jgi:hypothetical protein